MARRRLTTLEQLTAKQDALATQSKLLKKQRDALTRQRKRMERKAQEAHLLKVGELVSVYLQTDNLGQLEATLKRLMMFDLYPNNGFPTEQAMSSTASAALAPQEAEAE